jgi:hypothetical protein
VDSTADQSTAETSLPQSQAGAGASLDATTIPLQSVSRKSMSKDQPWLVGGESTAHDDAVLAIAGPRLQTLDQALEAVDRLFGKLA